MGTPVYVLWHMCCLMVTSPSPTSISNRSRCRSGTHDHFLFISETENRHHQGCCLGCLLSGSMPRSPQSKNRSLVPSQKGMPCQLCARQCLKAYTTAQENPEVALPFHRDPASCLRLPLLCAPVVTSLRRKDYS